MKTLKSVYYHINGTPTEDTTDMNICNNYVRADVYYDEGGMSYLSGRVTVRGYYMSAHTVGRYTFSGHQMESFQIFGNNGAKKLIFTANRQGKKQATNAEIYFDANIADFLRQIYPEMELTKKEEKVA